MIGTMCILMRKPKGEELSTLAVRTVWATFMAGVESTLLMLEDGVYNALDNPGYNSEMIKKFLEEDGAVRVHAAALAARGISKDSLIEGIELADDAQVAEMIEEAESTATF